MLQQSFYDVCMFVHGGCLHVEGVCMYVGCTCMCVHVQCMHACGHVCVDGGQYMHVCGHVCMCLCGVHACMCGHACVSVRQVVIHQIAGNSHILLLY